MKLKRLWQTVGVAVGMVVALSLTASTSSCEGGPTVESDSNQQYSGDTTVPVDSNFYTIKGTVAGAPSSMTRQESPAHGGVVAVNGFAGGSFFGPVESGKGFVRLQVSSATPAIPGVADGNVVILKTTDTKAVALYAGDEVTFKCRRQYEAVAPVDKYEKFDVKDSASWELDYCRMVTAVIVPAAPTK